MSEVIEPGQTADVVDQRAAPAVLRLWDRRAAFQPFWLGGVAAVIAGGLLAAAIAAPSPTRHGVWAAAYLVLVFGVGQIVLGAGQTLLASSPPSRRTALTTAALFDVANLAILAGVVGDQMIVFDVGSMLLIVALLLFLAGVRDSHRPGWPLLSYRLFVGLLVVSIPIGMIVTAIGPR